MKKGLILVNAFYNPPSYYNQSTRLKEEFEKKGISIDILKNDFFPAYIDKCGSITSFTSQYDFCIFLDKDKYLSLMLEKSGLRLFNKHDAIRICDDKMDTFIYLSGNNIKMPKTLSGLLCYDKNAVISENTILKIENELNYPIIVKESYGSLGKNVYLANNRTELSSLMQDLKLKPHLFQECIKTSIAKDVRIIVIGKEKIFAMKRQSNIDFRSNVELGGVASKIDLPNSFKDLAIKVANLIDLDYCGIDLLIGENNEPILCEVNSNAFFGGIEKVTGENIAKCYVEYIIKEVYKN